ncbi:MAG: TolC family protein [Pseudomonadota bacterium]
MRKSVFIAIMLTTGCTSLENRLVGPPAEITPPLPAVPDRWAAAGVVGTAESGDWLAQFNDPVLYDIIVEAITGSPQVKTNAAQAEAAAENARAIYGRSLPSLRFTSQDGVVSSAFDLQDQGIPGAPPEVVRITQSTFGLNFTASYEFDLWGRIAAANRAASADFLATEADLAAAALSLGGQAATAWMDLNEAQAQVKVAQITKDARQRVLDLTERRFSRGLSTALEVRTARTQLAGAEAQIASQQLLKANAARRLEVLLGRYPANEIEGAGELPDLPPIQIGGAPSLLIARRPDVAAAEARLNAAGLRAEEARLAILPALSVSGSASTSDNVFQNIFDPERIGANFLANFSQTVWNGGSLRAQKRANEAQARASAAQYANTVLTAWREVEDAIDSDRLLNVQLEAQMRSLEEAILAENLGERQYQNGLINIFDLLNLQTTRLNTESQVITARANLARNRISYHVALGGDGTNFRVDPTTDGYLSAKTDAVVEVSETAP